MKNKKAAIALSGGVDSGLAASLLKEQGWQVIAFYFHLQGGGNKLKPKKSFKIAKQTAKVLKIPFYNFDLKKEFNQEVLQRVLEQYKRGLTPNPCILCNKYVRFKNGLKLAKKHNCQVLATGHYARIIGGRVCQAKDQNKDQSYFLYFLQKSQLKKLLFPLGGWFKEKVWPEAEKRGLPAGQSPESMDVCFAGSLNIFLKQKLKKAVKPGPVVNLKGRILGRHQGLPLYTIGQTGGWQWQPEAQKAFTKEGGLSKFYVVGKNLGKNQLVVGSKNQAKKDQFEVKVDCWHGLTPGQVWLKIRSVGRRLKVDRLEPLDSRLSLRGLNSSQGGKFSLKVNLVKGELGITPGQTAVFYQSSRAKTGQSGLGIVGGGQII